MTKFTRGAHGYVEEEGLALQGTPQHPGYDEGARMEHGLTAQHPEMVGLPGKRYDPQGVSAVFAIA